MGAPYYRSQRKLKGCREMGVQCEYGGLRDFGTADAGARQMAPLHGHGIRAQMLVGMHDVDNDVGGSRSISSGACPVFEPLWTHIFCQPKAMVDGGSSVLGGLDMIWLLEAEHFWQTVYIYHLTRWLLNVICFGILVIRRTGVLFNINRKPARSGLRMRADADRHRCCALSPVSRLLWGPAVSSSIDIYSEGNRRLNDPKFCERPTSYTATYLRFS